MKLYRGLSLVALGLVAALGADSLRAAWRQWRDLTPPRRDVVMPDLPELREVSFRTRDGVLLRGAWRPSHNGAAVVLSHGYGENRLQVLPEAQLLMERGYGVLLYDLRGHGQSEGTRTTYGLDERLDVRAALDFVSRQPGVDPARLGSLGFSIGATAALLEALDDPRVHALALEGMSSSLRHERSDELRHDSPVRSARLPAMLLTLRLAGVSLDALDAARAVTRLGSRPVLFVYGDHDPDVPMPRVRALYAQTHSPKRMLVLPSTGHGHYIEHAPEAMARSLDDLYAALLPGERSPQTPGSR